MLIIIFFLFIHIFFVGKLLAVPWGDRLFCTTTGDHGYNFTFSAVISLCQLRCEGELFFNFY